MFAKKVRDLLKMRGIKQAELARRIGAHTQVVDLWLSKGRVPKAPYLLKVARALGVTVDYLIDDAMKVLPRTEWDTLSDDERFLLRSFRNEKIDVDTADRRMRGIVDIDHDESDRPEGVKRAGQRNPKGRNQDTG